MAGVDLAEPSAAPSLEGLDHAERVEAMVNWWLENFEDPAEMTPYESREGGYQWVWGGPHEPDDLLPGYFDGASEEDLDAAVREISSDGIYEWAPNQSRLYEVPDEETEGLEEPPLNEQLQNLHDELLAIKEGIAQWRESMPSFGHNMPPEEFRVGPEEDDLSEAEKAVDIVQHELAKDDPISKGDVGMLQDAWSAINNLGLKVNKWILAGGALAAAAIAQGAFKEAGSELMKNPQLFLHKLQSASHIIGAWLAVLTAPF